MNYIRKFASCFRKNATLNFATTKMRSNLIIIINNNYVNNVNNYINKTNSNRKKMEKKKIK